MWRGGKSATILDSPTSRLRKNPEKGTRHLRDVPPEQCPRRRDVVCARPCPCATAWPDRGAPAGVPLAVRGKRTILRLDILLGQPDMGPSDAGSHGKTQDVPPSPPSGHAPPGTVYCVEPSAAPGGHPRPSAGVATVAVCVRPPRPSHTPCAGASRTRRPQPQTPAPVFDPTRSRCGLVSVPPDRVDFSLENAQRGRCGQRLVFSQDLGSS